MFMKYCSVIEHFFAFQITVSQGWEHSQVLALNDVYLCAPTKRPPLAGNKNCPRHSSKPSHLQATSMEKKRPPSLREALPAQRPPCRLNRARRRTRDAHLAPATSAFQGDAGSF